MAISEANRLAMHLGLRRVLGDEQADILMEHLPPGGWADVARKDDITTFRAELTATRREFDGVHRRFDEVDQKIDSINRRFFILTGAILTVGVGLFAIQVQVVLQLLKLN